MPPPRNPDPGHASQLALKRKDLSLRADRDHFAFEGGSSPPPTSCLEHMNLFLQNQLNPAPFTEDP